MANIENIGDGDPRQNPSKEQPSWENQKKIIYEALMMLAEISPRDANLIRLHFEGCGYDEMAIREFDGSDAQLDEVSNLTASIKRQFSDKRTGSMAKFKIIIKRLMEKKQFLSEC